jgi:hypothetical protein
MAVTGSKIMKTHGADTAFIRLLVTVHVAVFLQRLLASERGWALDAREWALARVLQFVPLSFT